MYACCSPERVLVNYGVLGPIQVEGVRDERFSLLPDLLGFLRDEPLFAPL